MKKGKTPGLNVNISTTSLITMIDEKRFCFLILILLVIEGATLLTAQALPSFLYSLNLVLLEDFQLKGILDITYPAFASQIKALRDHGLESVVPAFSIIVYFSFVAILIDLFSSVFMYRKQYVGEVRRIENAINRSSSSYYWVLSIILLFTIGSSLYLLVFREFTFDEKVQFIYPGYFGSLLNGLLIFLMLRFSMRLLLWEFPISIRYLYRIRKMKDTRG